MLGATWPPIPRHFHLPRRATRAGCLDNDDGSAWYKIHDNFCVYGGHKSDFDGHSKESFDNLHIYASVYGDRCLQIGAQFLPQPGFPEIYANNTCVLVPGAECLDLGQAPANVPAPPAFYQRIQFYNNTIYTEQGAACRTGGASFQTLAAMQSGGFEAGAPSTIVSTLPDAATIIGWATAKLSGGGVRSRAATAAEGVPALAVNR